ncbi:hypothetical protein [Prescottella equi]|uniref:hypothetical protein n=1 Tax=Rhodococcus hoagii TaxID=43767 RepID=UPI00351B6094
MPTRIMNGGDDRIVPIANSAETAVTLVKNARLKVYARLPHAMCTVNADTLDTDLLDFIES